MDSINRGVGKKSHAAQEAVAIEAHAVDSTPRCVEEMSIDKDVKVEEKFCRFLFMTLRSPRDMLSEMKSLSAYGEDYFAGYRKGLLINPPVIPLEAL